MKNTTTDFISYNFKRKESLYDDTTDSDIKDKIIKIKLFSTTKVVGSFFSCIYKGKLRIHIVFMETADNFIEELDILIKETMENSGCSEGKIWLCNDNVKMINYLEEKFHMALDGENFFYESYELIIYRNKFNYKFASDLLVVKPYQQERIDDYLLLLNNSMSFKIPPYDYINSKEHFANEFKNLSEKNAFEAFWIDDELVGLYWLEGTEIDHLAVSTSYQHLGYGTQILTRAIEVIFQNHEVDYAWLLVVGWNSKAFNFYKAYGFEIKALHYVPYNNQRL